MSDRVESWKVNPPAPEYFESLSWDEFTKELGRQLAIARRQVAGVCQVCGQPFVGTTKRKYCSNRCAVRAFRCRQREATLP
jgi:hypothetical protein